jgi:malonyl-CoA decarboxylase
LAVVDIQSRWRRVLTQLGVSGDKTRTRSPSAVDDALALCRTLIAHPADAGQVKLAEALAGAYRQMDDDEAAAFFAGLARQFAPDPAALSTAARAYLDDPSAARATELSAAAEPPRQEVMRRLNTARDGTALIVGMRHRAMRLLPKDSAIAPLAADLRHLLTSWFNRGFLEVREINWRTPAAILEKLIRYEAVHAIRDWSDLRNRVEGNRRCFAFFHPSMPEEPLIFIEVALTHEISESVGPLLTPSAEGELPGPPRAAIFYSISNCQPGLRNIQFGDFLIKQVVAELQAQFPSLRVFATLSPIPGFRTWLEEARVIGRIVPPGLSAALATGAWLDDARRAEAMRAPLLGLCARYLVGVAPDGAAGQVKDPVARFHLSNGARLERINWRANLSPNGVQQSWGMMVNYRYRPGAIDANQEAFAFEGRAERSRDVAALLNAPIRFEEAAVPKLVGED